LSDKTKDKEMGVERGLYWRKKTYIESFVENPVGKRPNGTPRRRLGYYIKIYLQEIRRERVDWIKLVQDRNQWWALMNVVRNLRVHFFTS